MVSKAIVHIKEAKHMLQRKAAELVRTLALALALLPPEEDADLILEESSSSSSSSSSDLLMEQFTLVSRSAVSDHMKESCVELHVQNNTLTRSR